MNYDHAFIISYAHAGGALLQEVLNAHQGVCIRGENAGTMFALSRTAINIQTTTRFAGMGAAKGSAWHGADVIKAADCIREMVQSVVTHVLRPPQDTRLLGFAETRHLMPEPQLFEYLDFLRQQFPRSLLIFNTRDLSQNSDIDLATIQRVNGSFQTYVGKHPSDCMELDYDHYIADEHRLAPLFDRLGLQFDIGKARDILSHANPALRVSRTLEPGTIENGVIAGKDGWLFLWGGSNEVHRYYTDPDHFDMSAARNWVRLLEDRRARMAEIGAIYRHVIVPDKISVHADLIPVALPNIDGHPARLIARELPWDDLNVDILDDLKALPRPGFYRTDTHWNFAGCYAAYRRLCTSLNVTPRNFPVPDTQGNEITLDLGNKLTPPVQEKAQFVHILRNARRVADNEMVRYNESEGLRNGTPRFVGCHIRTLNETPEVRPETVVLFGDSFSEFRPHLLTAMLAETFREVWFVWSTSLDFEFIARIRPDIVITEIAERFMTVLPTDDFRVSLD